MFFELFVSSRCAFDCFFACKGSNFFVMLYKIYCFFNVNVYDIHYFIITQIFIKHRDTKSQRKKLNSSVPLCLCVYINQFSAGFWHEQLLMRPFTLSTYASMTATATMFTTSRTYDPKSMKCIGLFNPIWIGPIISTSEFIACNILYDERALVRLGNTRVLTSLP